MTTMNSIERLAGIEPAVPDPEAVEEEMWEYVTDAPVARDAPWQITSLAAADWAMAKLAELHAAADEYDLMALRYSDAAKRLRKAGQFFNDHLEAWAIAERTDAQKSFPMAHGNVTTSAHKPKAIVDDEAVLIEWARTKAGEDVADQIVKVEESIRLTEWRRLVRVDDLVTEWEAIDKASGETQRVPLTKPVRFTPERLAKVQAKMGDGFTVTAVTELAVFYLDADTPVPGSAVQEAYTTASVKPAPARRR